MGELVGIKAVESAAIEWVMTLERMAGGIRETPAMGEAQPISSRHHE